MKSRIIGWLGAGLAVLTLVVGGTTTAGATTDVVTAVTTPSPAKSVELQQAAVAATTSTSTDVGVLAQGGFDRDHWWFKISKHEVITIGAEVVCKAVFRGPVSWVCGPISAAVNWALTQYPQAGGFWAELYTNGQVRVGTW
jgi:hypothetical protein